MTREQVLALFESIKRGRTRGGGRALNKPLLLLHALARFADGDERLRFTEIEDAVKRLLIDFGPADGPYHVSYPFWRLQNDGLWVVENADAVEENASGDPRSVVALRELDPVGRFTDEVADALRTDPSLVGELMDGILADEFPSEAYDEEVRTAIGFDRDPPSDVILTRRRRRDPTFRKRVLDAYEHRCAVCGFSAMVGDAHIGLDAAHVKWHQYGGPDEVPNGLALCALHHRLLDRGAFTVTASGSRERVVEVSERARGNEGFQQWMLAYHGQPLSEPVRTEYRVSEPATVWHRKEVFKGLPRT